jgi:thiamine phosphate synthase YjbQ (UPF0047 family)
MSFQNQISLNTKGHGDMTDITEQVAAVVNSSGVKTGIANVFNIGSTAAVGTIEFEPGLQGDMPAILDKLIPPSRNTATNKPGMMATAIPTCRQHCSGRH